MIESLRDIQRACSLAKVRKRLGVGRASLGSLSESVAIFDPAPLEEIAVGLCQRRQDTQAQTPPSERRPGWPW